MSDPIIWHAKKLAVFLATIQAGDKHEGTEKPQPKGKTNHGHRL